MTDLTTLTLAAALDGMEKKQFSSAELTDAPKEELEIARLPKAPEGVEVARVDVVIRLRRI